LIRETSRGFVVLSAAAIDLMSGAMSALPSPSSVRHNGAARATRYSSLIALAGLGGLLLLALTAALWAHYGTAVFYEMIVAGLAACL
jgi:hypothetical protein